MVNLFTVYELNRWLRDLSTEFTLGDCLFGGVKLTKFAHSDKYEYSDYGIKFGARSKVSLAIGKCG